MATTTTPIEIYGKQFTLCEFVFATNENQNKKLVWFEKINKKCCLSSVAPTSGVQHLYKMKMPLSRDEIVEFAEHFANVKKGTEVNQLLSEGEDYLGQPTRLVLATSKYKGLVLSRYLADKPTITVVTHIPDGDEDPDAPVEPNGNTSVPELLWREQFAKFYVGKNDDWAKELKKPTAKKKPATKKRKVELDSDDETKRAMSVIIAIMRQHDITAKEAVFQYRKEMEKEYPFDYLDLIRNDDDLELDRLYKEMLDKGLL
ncbi:Hypothetical predicted protein [Paramuricea clavata]|uniref:Uncharacterized protein n=1 Tax=Paramuricea clavata TaxID=317549 RepID=A0A6S7GE02_PARCT|nr:Hypothetical predicted protein [Paramuricea clavata]